MVVEAEVVAFQSPERHVVRVDAGPVDDYDAFAKMCGRYGAFQRSRLKRSALDGLHFLHYYQESAAKRACRGLDCASFRGRPLATSRGTGTGDARKLGRDDCVDLANGLLGAAGWSHRIVSLERRDADGGGSENVAVVALTFTLAPRGFELRGRGVGVGAGARADAVEASKKRAVNHALEDAFAALRLRVRRGAAEAVLVDPARVDAAR